MKAVSYRNKLRDIMRDVEADVEKLIVKLGTKGNSEDGPMSQNYIRYTVELKNIVTAYADNDMTADYPSAMEIKRVAFDTKSTKGKKKWGYVIFESTDTDGDFNDLNSWSRISILAELQSMAFLQKKK